MEYRPLGRTGGSVSQMCLGAMMFGSFGNADHDDAVRIIHRALVAGINFIDTADGYSAGESEQILGKALAGGRRAGVVLAVKFGPPFDKDPNHRGASRRGIIEGIEGSLRRLGTDWIDLYQVGVPDPSTDIDETLSALSDLARAGKIRYFGASKLPASQIVEAQWVADRRGYGHFRTEQPPYSMLTRAIEYDVLPTSQRHGMGVMVYSPLAGGWLSGKYRKGRKVSGPGSAARLRRLPAAMTRPTRRTPRSSTPPTGSTCQAICSTGSIRSSLRVSPSTSPTICGSSARPRLPPPSDAGRRWLGVYM
jgi:aryl-alcohol dehydrogenase-like predicted oxidoreductase